MRPRLLVPGPCHLRHLQTNVGTEGVAREDVGPHRLHLLDLPEEVLRKALQVAGPLAPRVAPWPTEAVGRHGQAAGEGTEAARLHACEHFLSFIA